MGVYLWQDVPVITTPGIYHNASLGLISLSSDGSNWITIADKNLGATTVYNDGDTLSEANCGKYYQWGNNYGFPRTGSVNTTSTQVNASTYGPGNYYSSSTFINNSSGWDSSLNTNLWGNTTDTLVARRGPCDEGYHIAKHTEWGGMYGIFQSLGLDTNNGNFLKTYLKMPYAGYRYRGSGAVSNQGGYALYWCSNPTTTSQQSYSVSATSSSYSSASKQTNSEGFSIRPFKNVAVQPYEGWVKLK